MNFLIFFTSNFLIFIILKILGLKILLKYILFLSFMVGGLALIHKSVRFMLMIILTIIFMIALFLHLQFGSPYNDTFAITLVLTDNRESLDFLQTYLLQFKNMILVLYFILIMGYWGAIIYLQKKY